MSKKEKIKAMIEFYKALIVAFMSALFGVLGYTFINYKKYETIDTIIVVCCLVSISLIIFVLAIFFRETNKLEKEK